jgi:3-hydroxybutyryl-CoA dehydratase
MRAAVAVTVGSELPARGIGPITATDIIRFAGAGGDFNPLHHDPLAAKEAGFDSVIAMGQMQAGMLASWVSDQFGIEHLREFSVRFTAPVRVGDRLELTGRVVGVRRAAGSEASRAAVADVEMAVTAGDVTVMTGRAVVQVSTAG